MSRYESGPAFDLGYFLANASISDFFESGTVTVGTGSTLVVEYSDETTDEQLTLNGSFGNYVDGYPTTGTITSISYRVDGTTLFTVTEISISVQAFTNFALADDLEGLFSQVLAGADTVVGSSGNDVLQGFGGDDVVTGLDGDDTLRGGTGSDQLYGGAGNDLLAEFAGDVGPFGNDLYDGGSGNDRVSYYLDFGPGVTVDLNQAGAQATGYGNDTFVSIEHVTATYGDDTLTGNAADNWFWTFNGSDNLYGNGGNDYFTVGLGNKIVDGGAGNDTIEILDLAFEPAYTADGITVSLLLQGQAQQTGVGSWTLSNIENLGGWWGADELTGDANGGIQNNGDNIYTVVDNAWHIAGVGDFNGDGRDDILWRNDNGAVFNFLGSANGGVVSNGDNSYTAMSNAWHVEAIGDYNGDGRDDILWQHDNGTIIDWLGTASGGYTDNSANLFTQVALTWHIQDPGTLWV